MAKTVLITGGAGFIGSHVADLLIRNGQHVRVLDNLYAQVHGPSRKAPTYLDPRVELVEGDIRDREAVERALSGIDQVVHLAAAVGVGQSMYDVETYTSVNNRGTAVLLQALIEKPVERLIVASSMSVYGEGRYQTEAGQLATPMPRTLAQLRSRDWAVHDAEGRTLTPVPTPESKDASLMSVYALSKFDQEKLCLMLGQAYHIPAIALRFFNVYGPRQALSNPYTGVLAIFATRLLNGNQPLVFEDGRQRRDFVSVYDVARACHLALTSERVDYGVFNIGSGESFTVCEIAQQLASQLNLQIEPYITGRYRIGDIRHCFADIQAARDLLGYEPQVQLEYGLRELVEWLRQQSSVDRTQQAHAELEQRGLSV